MAGEAPAGGAVHAGGGEGVEAQLRGTGVDVLRHGLEGLKVGDILHGVAGLFQQGLVGDDAERLVAVAHGQGVAVLAVEVELVGAQLFVEVGVLQGQEVIGPGIQAGLGAALEQRGGGVALVHLSGQGFGIGAGGGGDHGDGHTGLLGVGLGQRLPGLIGLGLEVEVVDLAGRFGGSRARNQGQAQRKRQNQSQQFLHEWNTPFQSICGTGRF